MARTMDITEKLGMQGRPQLVIGDVRVEVDNRAKTILQVLAVVGGDAESVDAGDIEKVYGLLFDAKARKELDGLELDFDDFTTLVMSAVDLVIGGEDEGEAGTPATA